MFILRSAAAFWAMTKLSKMDLTPTEIDLLWGELSNKQQRKWIKKHEKKQNEYAHEFETFVRVNSFTFTFVFKSFFLREFCI